MNSVLVRKTGLGKEVVRLSLVVTEVFRGGGLVRNDLKERS